jgi:hypothetical protein
MEVAIIYTVLKEIVQYFKNKKDIKPNKRLIVHLVLNIIRLNEATRNHIAHSEGNFVRSATLSNGYIALKEEMERYNPVLGDVFPAELLDMLGSKAIFWDRPQTFVENQPLRTLIPTLQEIDELCEELLNEI